MISKTITVNSKIGLHARPAAIFVQTASKFMCDLDIQKGDKKINAKSIMGVMALGVAYGDQIVLIADGEDEKNAIDELTNLLENDLAGES